MQLARSLPARYLPVWPYLNWGLFALGVLWSIGSIAGLLPWGGGGPNIIGDGHAYWAASQADPYAVSHMGERDAYLYAPAFLQAYWPLQLLPWELAASVWAALHFAAVAWLAPWMMVFPGVIDDTVKGNVNTFMAVALAVGMRAGWPWAFLLLTKVTPGVGLVWHLVRREWGLLGRALLATALIVGVSASLAPEHWVAWIELLSANQDSTIQIAIVPGALAARIVVGAVIVALAAWRGWAWAVPVGAFVAMPNTAPQSSAILAAIPRLVLQPANTVGAPKPTASA